MQIECHYTDRGKMREASRLLKGKARAFPQAAAFTSGIDECTGTAVYKLYYRSEAWTGRKPHVPHLHRGVGWKLYWYVRQAFKMLTCRHEWNWRDSCANCSMTAEEREDFSWRWPTRTMGVWF